MTDAVRDALKECASRCRYDGDLFHDQGNEVRRDASWLVADMANAALAATTELDIPLHKAIERILDDHSAWIARPNDEVTRAVAKLAIIAVHEIISEREALSATPADDNAVLDSYAEENQRLSDRIEELEAKLAAATPAVGGELEDAVHDIMLKYIELDYLHASDGHPDIVGFGKAAAAIAALAATPAVGGDMQRSELDDASNACLELCSKHGFATGHGDTVADMIREIDGQIQPASPLRGREAIAEMLKKNGFTSRDGTYLQGGTYGVIDAIRALSAADLDDPADVWDAYCAETPAKRRSPQGALAFGFHAAHKQPLETKA